MTLIAIVALSNYLLDITNYSIISNSKFLALVTPPSGIRGGGELVAMKIYKCVKGGEGTFTFNVTNGMQVWYINVTADRNSPSFAESNPDAEDVPPNSWCGASQIEYLVPGTWSITETVPSGWTFDEAGCFLEGVNFLSFSNGIGEKIENGVANLSLSALPAGIITVCSFTNTKMEEI